jgi:hypothetical protein
LFCVQQDVAPDPGNVGFFGADGIVLAPDGVANLVKKFLWTFLYFLPPQVIAFFGLLGYTDVKLDAYPKAVNLRAKGWSIYNATIERPAQRRGQTGWSVASTVLLRW